MIYNKLIGLNYRFRLTTAVDSISLKPSVTDAVEATDCVIASSIVMAGIQAILTFIHVYIDVNTYLYRICNMQQGL